MGQIIKRTQIVMGFIATFKLVAKSKRLKTVAIDLARNKGIIVTLISSDSLSRKGAAKITLQTASFTSTGQVLQMKTKLNVAYIGKNYAKPKN